MQMKQKEGKVPKLKVNGKQMIVIECTRFRAEVSLLLYSQNKI